MQRLASLAARGLALALTMTAPASAMYVNPQGSGQLLLFPYFTVNAGQSTLLTLVNTTDRAKYLNIKFREGYNSRAVLEFRIVLAPQDAWTSTVFSTDDAGAARIMTRDLSCTSPDKPEWEAPFPGGGYQQPFLPFAYVQSNADTGPTGPTRTREGHVEVVEIAELVGALGAAAAQRPMNCAPLRVVSPNSPDLRPPAGGIYGNFAVVDVAEGTLFGGSATAIDDFSKTVLMSETASLIEYLAAGNSRTGEADAILPAGAGATTLTYPNTGASARGGDALSALLMSDTVYGSMNREASVGSHTEWVLTAPTKFLYTDNQVLGLPPGQRAARPPFEAVFGAGIPGTSCSGYRARGYDREGREVVFLQDMEFITPPAGWLPQHSLCYATNVVFFSDAFTRTATPLLGSVLGTKLWNPSPAVETANVRLMFGERPPGGAGGFNLLPAGTRGPALRGLPLIGFEAVRYVNGNVTPGTLANYTMSLPLRAKVVCASDSGAVVACP